MCKTSVIVPAVLLLSAMLPVWSQGEPIECQYVLVVDEAQKGLRILDVGQAEIAGGVGLGTGEASDFSPGGVDFTTVPGFSDRFAFVAQGPFLRVIDLNSAIPRFTVDVESQFGLAGIRLNQLDAAGPVSIGSETRHLLYATGSLAAVPWALVFDQEALLESATLAQALLAAAPLQPNCADCAGVGLDIAAGGPPASGGVQEAYVSVFDLSDPDGLLRIYRLVLQEDFSFAATLSPWNDEGTPFNGAAHRVNGLDYDSTGTQPFGVFQTTSVVKDLSNGESSCELGGYPTDVAVWGPASGMEHPVYHFVTAVNPLGPDRVFGFPAGECPDGGVDSLSFPTSDLPRALALSSPTSDTLWVYSAHKNSLITALHLRLSSDSEEGDRIELLESLEIPALGGFKDVAIRDESHHECIVLGGWQPVSDPRNPRVDCDEDPDDPRCRKPAALEPKPPGGE